MSTNQVDAPSPRLSAPPEQGGSPRSAPPAPPGRGSIRDFADRWPFRRKLNILVGVPLTVVAVLLGYLITQQLRESSGAASAAQLVRDSTQVAQLVGRVQAEHQQAILLSVRHQAAYDGGTPSSEAYRMAQLAVDTQIEKVRDTFGDRLPAAEAQALREVEGLENLRNTIEQGYLPADNIDPAYAGAAEGLINGLGLDRDTDLAATFTGTLLDSLLRADSAHGAFETGVLSARTGDTNALIEFTGAVGSYELYTYQAERFTQFASEEQADELAGIEHTPAQAAIIRHYAELQIDPSALQAETTAQIRAALKDSIDSYPGYLEQAQERLKITTSLIDQIADRADDASTDAQWRAGLLLSLALFGFAAWIAFSAAVRRSVIRPVQALTGAAQEVADAAGRELARVADDDAEAEGPPLLRAIPVTAHDEIGELAEVFNRVQTTAVGLLERQVLSRRNVAEMFGNMGRRVSNLTTRQLALIDSVERGETDPALLEHLYSIDHIAVRLRRNADSLMLLAGIRETVLASGPTALANVVRAALGQIEDFQRVELHAGTTVMVAPDLVGDLTLMVAELLENAVSFSPAGSPVEVTVRSGDTGATITIADHGLGMSAERLAEENGRLIRRERLDLVPTKVLGLFVVGTLARRWEVGVDLSRTRGGGVTAEVTIPSSLLLTMSAVASRGPAGTADPSRTGTSTATDRPDTAASGPRPSPSAAPSAGEPADEHPGALPRRVLRREQGAADAPGTGVATDTTDGTAPRVPAPRAEVAPAAGGADDAGGTRPLRRRVRGATLRTTVDAGQQSARQTAVPDDADAVRSALEEFEAGVERAHQDTASHALPAQPDPSTSHPHDPNRLPEGAEQ
ncbi:sensor histidine kinase [Streptomyces adustus]|uniref:sensor histidine kinase n=1 Tax=Streptomyces adustus TaxID=1609272 RepID=UPI00371572FD